MLKAPSLLTMNEFRVLLMKNGTKLSAGLGSFKITDTIQTSRTVCSVRWLLPHCASNYASRLIGRVLDGDVAENESGSEMSDRAILATRKAIDLYPHPVLFSRLADFLEKTGWANDAKTIREIQRKQQSVWVEKRTDELLMIRLDPDIRTEDE